MSNGSFPGFSGNLGIPGQLQAGAPSAGPSPGNHSEFTPHNHDRAIAEGAQVAMLPAYPPTLPVINGCRYMWKTRSIVVGGNGITAQTYQAQNFQFFQPGLIYSINASAYLADNTGLPNGRSSLDTFKVRFYFSAGSTTVLNVTNLGGTTPILASTVLGTGQLPGFIGGLGLKVEQGWQLSVDVQTLLDNLEATITLQFLEEYRG